MPLPDRKQLRLTGFDYRSNQAYFVTLCTQNRQCVFGKIEHGNVTHTRRGLIANECWQAIPEHHPHVELDAFVVMPNHVHGILRFVGGHAASTGTAGIRHQSLGSVVGTYKAAVVRRINHLRPHTADGLWQRGYHDHVFRHERAYEYIWHYIHDNPRQWSADQENPDAIRPIDIADVIKVASSDAGDMYVAPTNFSSTF